MTALNIIDLLLVLFCTATLILVFKSPCSEGTRRQLPLPTTGTSAWGDTSLFKRLLTSFFGTEEEVLDTILLVIRNAVQFLRLGNILRRSVSFPSPLFRAPPSWLIKNP